MSNPTPPAAPETLAAAVEKLHVHYDEADEEGLNPMYDRDDVVALAAQHDAEMARLRQERDAAHKAVSYLSERAHQEWTRAERLAPALTREQAEAKLTEAPEADLEEIGEQLLDAPHMGAGRYRYAIQRILDTLFGHGDPTA